MSTSDTTISPRPRVWREIAWITPVASCAVYIASPADPALTAWPIHPVWIVGFVVAARYGARGLWILPALFVGLVGGELLSGDDGLAPLARLSRGGDLVALFAIALCAAVGTAHEQRKRALEQRLIEVEARAGAAEAAVDNLVKTAIALHDHRDRSHTSLAFLADVSRRLNGRRPGEAASAALELALARTGARAGFVQVFDRDGSARTLASRGSSRKKDRTAAAAREQRGVVFAHEVPCVRVGDSDVAVALIDADNEVVGVLALRGMPYTTLDATLAAELSCIAAWAAPALARARIQVVPLLPERRARPVKLDGVAAEDRAAVWERGHGA